MCPVIIIPITILPVYLVDSMVAGKANQAQKLLDFLLAYRWVRVRLDTCSYVRDQLGIVLQSTT